MRYEIFLAARYLCAPRRSVLAKLTTAAALVGITAGVAAMIFALALGKGFAAAMQDKILQNTQHIAVFRADAAEILDWQDLCEKIKTIKNVKNATAQSFDNALLIGETGSALAAVRGGETIQIEQFKIQNLQSGGEDSKLKIENQKPKIEIGKVLAEKTGLGVGETAEIVGGAGDGADNFAPVATVVEVRAIFETGLYEYDSTWVRASLADAWRITGRKDLTATAIGIEIADVYEAKAIAAKVAAVVGADYRVLDWQEANRPLFAALALERRAAVLIVSVLIFIAALNVTTTLALVVNERRGDIAVLKTCGACSRSIVLIFLLEGALLGAAGALLGLILGAAVCFAGNRLGLLNLPAEVYEINRISLRLDLIDVLTTVGAVLVLSLAATVLPALAAAKIRPLDNLKN